MAAPLLVSCLSCSSFWVMACESCRQLPKWRAELAQGQHNWLSREPGQDKHRSFWRRPCRANARHECAIMPVSVCPPCFFYFCRCCWSPALNPIWLLLPVFILAYSFVLQKHPHGIGMKKRKRNKKNGSTKRTQMTAPPFGWLKYWLKATELMPEVGTALGGSCVPD